MRQITGKNLTHEQQQKWTVETWKSRNKSFFFGFSWKQVKTHWEYFNPKVLNGFSGKKQPNFLRKSLNSQKWYIGMFDSVANRVFPEKSHADKSNAKWETFMRFYQVFQFFQIFIIYAQRKVHIWTKPSNSALKIT